LSIVPHAPVGHVVSGVHVLTHAFVVVLQVRPVPHVPQLTVPPQPSGSVPQTCPAAHDVAGVQVHVFVAASHVPVLHVPQWIVPPQPLS